MSNSIYFSLKESVFEKFRKEAKQAAAGMEDYLVFNNVELVSDVEFGKDTLLVTGDIKKGDEELGYISIEFNLPFEVVTSILESYVKKVNKIKTILEAST